MRKGKHCLNWKTSSLTERKFQMKLQIIRSDNGFEFMCLAKFIQDCGVVHETSSVGIPQQHGKVERKHRHTLNVLRALRVQAKHPIEFWGEECVFDYSLLDK